MRADNRAHVAAQAAAAAGRSKARTMSRAKVKRERRRLRQDFAAMVTPEVEHAIRRAELRARMAEVSMPPTPEQELAAYLESVPGSMTDRELFAALDTGARLNEVIPEGSDPWRQLAWMILRLLYEQNRRFAPDASTRDLDALTAALSAR